MCHNSHVHVKSDLARMLFEFCSFNLVPCNLAQIWCSLAMHVHVYIIVSDLCIVATPGLDKRPTKLDCHVPYILALCTL